MQPGTLLAVPLFHVTALHASYLASYRLQRRVVCMYRWDAEAAAALIEREQLSSVVAPAAVTGDLVRVAQQGKHDLSCLLAVGGGGAPRAPEQVRQIATSFGNALPNIGWGMTETNAIGAGNSGEDYLRKPASSGRCSLVLQLKVVDDAGAELPAGQRGELLMRGTSVFGGYWKRPEANAQAFTDGDWFRTGDVACIDDEGFLFIVDRIKDLIIRGGENIGCGHVEAALLLHPLVQEAAVYAVPDERLGEEVGATLYASEALDLDELRQFLATHLARFELPRHLLRAEAAAAAHALGQDLQATDPRDGAGRDRAGRCVSASAAQRRSSSSAPATISAAEPRLQAVGSSPKSSQPRPAAHTRPVYSSGAARLASTWVKAQVMHTRPPVASRPISSTGPRSAALIACQPSAAGPASSTTGSRFCTSRMVHSASRCAWCRASTTTPA